MRPRLTITGVILKNQRLHPLRSSFAERLENSCRKDYIEMEFLFLSRSLIVSPQSRRDRQTHSFLAWRKQETRERRDLRVRRFQHVFPELLPAPLWKQQTVVSGHVCTQTQAVFCLFFRRNHSSLTCWVAMNEVHKIINYFFLLGKKGQLLATITCGSHKLQQKWGFTWFYYFL